MAVRLVRIHVLAKALLRVFGVSMVTVTESPGAGIRVETRRTYGERELVSMAPIGIGVEDEPE